jgi:hypothetical protein
MILACWCLVSLALVAMWAVDYRPHHDADDILKFYQLRHVLATGSLVDRVLPNIAQPEPFVSHWTWIADAPYLAAIFLLKPFLGQELALSVAVFAVPLALLLPAFGLVYKMIERLGFNTPAIAFLPGVLTSAFAEFQPGRIDYHSLQMLLMLVLVVATMTTGRRSAAVGGIAAALSFSISLELAMFVALAMAIHAARYVVALPGAAQELSAFGTGLLAAAAGLFLAINPSPPWLGQACDQYSLPYFVALGGAGLSFVLGSRFLPDDAGPMARICLIGVCGAATAAVLATMFPQCLSGPYGQINAYVAQNYFGQIEQEKSIFSSSEFALSGNLAAAMLMLLGPGAVVAAVVAGAVRGRAWVVAALFVSLAIMLGLAYLRYQRFVPWLGGPGWALILAAMVPAASRWRPHFTNRLMRWQPGGLLLASPIMLVATAVIAVQIINPPKAVPPGGADLAEFCAHGQTGPRAWPAGARILAPPSLAVRMLRTNGPEVVAVPFHRAAEGLERTFRFFDPATRDPRVAFDQTGATHVVVCALGADVPASLRGAYPFTLDLMLGKGPEWLTPCPVGPGDKLRVYRLTSSQTTSCPNP